MNFRQGAWAVAVAATLLVAVEGWRRQPERQVHAALQHLEVAFRERDASAFFGYVHRDYPVATLWPDLFGDREAAVARQDAQRLLAVVFLQHAQQDLECRLTPQQMVRDGDTVTVTLSILVTGGMFGQVVPALSGHEVRFRQASWLTGRWAVVGHQPVPLNR